MTTWKRFTVTRGDTIVLESQILDDSSDPLDLTGALSIISTVKEALSDTVALATIGVGTGITVDSLVTATITRTYPGSMTDGLADGAKLYGDVEVTLADGTVGTPEHFVLIVDADVTP